MTIMSFHFKWFVLAKFRGTINTDTRYSPVSFPGNGSCATSQDCFSFIIKAGTLPLPLAGLPLPTGQSRALQHSLPWNWERRGWERKCWWGYRTHAWLVLCFSVNERFLMYPLQFMNVTSCFRRLSSLKKGYKLFNKAKFTQAPNCTSWPAPSSSTLRVQELQKGNTEA